jgi:Tol biopolymer transport system component
MLTWSPDGKEILASVSGQTLTGQVVNPTVYLLKADQFNEVPSDVTSTLPTLLSNWDRQRARIERSKINSLPGKLSKATKDFKIISYSPDGSKILYEASKSATLPIIKTPRLIGVNATPESRDLKEGEIYIYDGREDRNYHLSKEDFQGTYNWLPDSSHLVFVKDKKIQIIEHDGTNKTTFYAGPFNPNYVFPWSDGTRVVILTDLGNSSISPNLYTISLK